jgi:cytoskeletal protein CcmA (bactofilin family)
MKFTKDNQDDILSNLGEGVELVGELTFTRGFRSDGTIKGQIRSESLFAIGQKGKVEADITIKRITINGEFRGTIRASDRVEIHKDGKVYGDIYTPCLIIEAGAIFEGKCNMTERRASRGEEPAILKVVDSGGEAGKAPQHAAGKQ